MNASVQGSNSLWNIDFSNPDSVATINKTANVEKEDDGSTLRGLGFMSYVYAKLEAGDETDSPMGGYVVEDASFLGSHTTDDVKNFLVQNGTTYSAPIEWADFEDVLTEEQITSLKTKYDGNLNITDFTKAMGEIQEIIDTIEIKAGDEPIEDIDAYQYFLKQMSKILDDYSKENILSNSSENSDGTVAPNEETQELWDFLQNDYNTPSLSSTLSFADHFENMLNDLTETTNMNVAGMFDVLDSLRAEEQQFGFYQFLDQLSPETISGLMDYTNGAIA